MDLDCGNPANYIRIILWEAWGAPNQAWIPWPAKNLPHSPIQLDMPYVFTNKQAGTAADLNPLDFRVRSPAHE
jgi:hypothetical protein